MSEKSIEEKVKDIIVEQLGVNPEQVTPNASFIEDLGADSLDTVELVMAFEEEFSVEVPDEDAEKLILARLLTLAPDVPVVAEESVAAGRTPKVWGLHNYVDANTLSTKTTKRLLASVVPKLVHKPKAGT